MGEIRVKSADGWLNLPSHEKTADGWKDIPTHIMTATGWQGELTSQSPLEFKATGQSLLDWRVDGRTSGNLFDESYNNIEANALKYYPIAVPDDYYTLSSTTPLFANQASIFLLAGNASSGASTATNGVSDGISRTVGAQNGYITICYRITSSSVTEAKVDPRDFQTMLNTGSTALPYEPYGGVGDWDETEQQYKIPITVNGVTTNLYTDHQLMDGDSMNFATDQTTIPITQGDNTLTVDTQVQPKSVFVKFEG